MTDIYVNIDAINERDAAGTVESKIVFSSTGPFLPNPSEYKGTILRLSIPIQEIPIFLFDGDEKGSDYVVTVDYGGLEVRQEVLFTTEWKGGPSSTPTTNQFYYGVYFYQHMIDMVNTAIYTAWTAVGSPYQSPPWFGFNPVTELFTLYYTNAYIGGGFRLFFNNTLRILFASFNMDFYGYNIDKSTEFSFYRQYSTTAGPNSIPAGIVLPSNVLSVGLTWYQIADYSTLASWNQFDKILLVCNNLPILNEFNNPINLNQSSSSSDVTLPILTDFIIDVNATSRELRGILQYAPRAEFRWFDLVGTQPCSQFTVDIYALLKTSLNNYANLYKVLIPPGETIHLKLLFRKKSEFATSTP